MFKNYGDAKIQAFFDYQRRLPQFTNFIEKLNFETVNQSIEIKINNKAKKGYSLKAQRLKANEQSYYIVSLDVIQSILEKRGNKAWHNLMKVVSHELMNTISPIQSLMEHLQDTLKNVVKNSNETDNDVLQIMEIIN